MRRVIAVINGIRPRCGKIGAACEFKQLVEQTNLHQHGFSVGVIKEFPKIVRRLFQRCHARPNDPKLSHGH